MIDFTANNTISEYWKNGGPKFHLLPPRETGVNTVVVSQDLYNKIDKACMGGASFNLPVKINDKNGTHICRCWCDVFVLLPVQKDDLVTQPGAFTCYCPKCEDYYRFLPCYKYEFVKVITHG